MGDVPIYCEKCRRERLPAKPNFNIIIFVLMFIFLCVIGGLVYVVYWATRKKVCPVCGEYAWGSEDGARKDDADGVYGGDDGKTGFDAAVQKIKDSKNSLIIILVVFAFLGVAVYAIASYTDTPEGKALMLVMECEDLSEEIELLHDMERTGLVSMTHEIAESQAEYVEKCSPKSEPAPPVEVMEAEATLAEKEKQCSYWKHEKETHLANQERCGQDLKTDVAAIAGRTPAEQCILLHNLEHEYNVHGNLCCYQLSRLFDGLRCEEEWESIDCSRTYETEKQVENSLKYIQEEIDNVCQG